ncbi:Phosphoesterase PA-phosphatase related protein [uncultured Paludibacter sp.]|uniref:Phosphoesterase PA-phosphatase related protein n=1 Tax=uncultured Paludibacter sp. TaxID=497635 RepID=A0A653AB49_9BACT|nr:Phosphoesterase PA-phosphatase related protein [uncultured Paludibacter sp.]
MEIIHYLDSIDKQWLLALNNDYPAFWDNLMLLISAKLVWIPFYAAILFVVIKKWKKESWWIVLGLILCIVIADQTASGVLKNVVQRLRPSRDPSIQDMVVLVNNYKAGGYSFVSSHAANSFGLALLTSLLFKNRIYTIVVLLWAALVAYSRVFLGVHYPGDVLGGAIVGVFAALFVYWLIKKLHPVLFRDSNQDKIYYNIPILTLLATLVTFLIYSAAV